MTLYCAQLDSEGNPLKEEDGTYKKGDAYTTWLSGYEYDDNGNLKLDDQGHPIPTTEPHWIDHIPVGFYVLEETICPYEQGYVQSVSVNIDVLETGNVQSLKWRMILLPWKYGNMTLKMRMSYMRIVRRT